MSRLAPLGALLGLLLASSASAEPPRVYTSLQGGLSIGHDADVSDRRGPANGEIRYEHGSLSDPGDLGWAGEAALGLHFNHGEKHSFRTEIAGGYQRADIKKLQAPVTGVTLARGGHTSVASALFNVYYEHDFGNLAWVKAFVGGGLGAGFVEVGAPRTSSLVSIDDESAELAWNLAAGVVLPLAEHVDLQASYRFLGTTDAELEATARDPNTGVVSQVGEVDTEVGFHHVMLGLRLTF